MSPVKAEKTEEVTKLDQSWPDTGTIASATPWSRSTSEKGLETFYKLEKLSVPKVTITETDVCKTRIRP